MGFLTFIMTMCGLKVWICICDEDGEFLEIDMFRDFELDDADGYCVEAVVLMPGTML